MLTIPPLLADLIATGRWPSDQSVALSQNLRLLAPKERIRRLAPEEHTICLFPPPFRTVAERVALSDNWWSNPVNDPDGISFDLAVEIGDFGLGSDSPIVLDYRGDFANPRVVRLQYPHDGTPNRWVQITADFSTFVEVLGL